jgi:hypothetical protein
MKSMQRETLEVEVKPRVKQMEEGRSKETQEPVLSRSAIWGLGILLAFGG